MKEEKDDNNKKKTTTTTRKCMTRCTKWSFTNWVIKNQLSCAPAGASLRRTNASAHFTYDRDVYITKPYEWAKCVLTSVPNCKSSQLSSKQAKNYRSSSSFRFLQFAFHFRFISLTRAHIWRGHIWLSICCNMPYNLLQFISMVNRFKLMEIYATKLTRAYEYLCGPLFVVAARPLRFLVNGWYLLLLFSLGHFFREKGFPNQCHPFIN